MSDAKSTTERVLELIVMAGIADRLRAVSLRGAKGDEAAIEYLRRCTITNEVYGPTTWTPDLQLVVDNTRRAPDETEPEHAQ